MALASNFKYKPRTAEQVEKRLNRTGGSFQSFLHDDYKTFKPAVGDNFIRFLPATWNDPEHWGYEVHVHYSVGPERASVLCLSKMYGKKCPICEAQAVARKDGDEERVRELAPRLQVVSWIVNMKDTAQGVMLWSMSFKMDSNFIQLTRDRESGELLQIDNPEEGYNVSFTRKGTTMKDTEYSGYQTSRKPSAIEMAWLEYAVAHPIPSTFVHRDYDEIKALFEGNDKKTEETAEAEEAKEAETKPDTNTKPAFVSKRSAPKEPEPEAVGEVEGTAEEAEKPAADAAAEAGMSSADKLRAKLAARKAANK